MFIREQCSPAACWGLGTKGLPKFLGSLSCHPQLKSRAGWGAAHGVGSGSGLVRGTRVRHSPRWVGTQVGGQGHGNGKGLSLIGGVSQGLAVVLLALSNGSRTSRRKDALRTLTPWSSFAAQKWRSQFFPLLFVKVYCCFYMCCFVLLSFVCFLIQVVHQMEKKEKGGGGKLN